MDMRTIAFAIERSIQWSLSVTMGTITHYCSVSEVDCDHTRHCGKCGRDCAVVCRLIAKGYATHTEGTLSLFGDGGASARRAAQENALWVRPLGHRPWHRCTHCGHYGEEDLARMSRCFPGFRDAAVCVLISSWVLSALPLLVGCSLLWKQFDAFLPKECGIAVTFLILGPCLVRRGWKGYRRATRENFSKLLESVNEPDRVSRWLAQWKAKSPRLLAPFVESTGATFSERYEHASFWPKLAKLQHKFDPIPPEWELVSDAHRIRASIRASVGTVIERDARGREPDKPSEIARDFKNCVQTHLKESRRSAKLPQLYGVWIGDEIHERLLAKLRKRFLAQFADEEELILILNMSILKGRCCAVFTDRAVYWQNNRRQGHRCRYENIRSIQIQLVGGMEEDKVLINGDDPFMFNRPLLCNAALVFSCLQHILGLEPAIPLEEIKVAVATPGYTVNLPQLRV